MLVAPEYKALSITLALAVFTSLNTVSCYFANFLFLFPFVCSLMGIIGSVQVCINCDQKHFFWIQHGVELKKSKRNMVQTAAHNNLDILHR